MLEQLLALKKRREGGIRQRLARNRQCIVEVEQRKVQLVQQRIELHQQWRISNQQQQQVKQGNLYQVQENYSDFYQSDQDVVQQQQQQQKRLADLVAEQAHLRQQLQHNRVEQEKLTYVLENQS